MPPLHMKWPTRARQKASQPRANARTAILAVQWAMMLMLGAACGGPFEEFWTPVAPAPRQPETVTNEAMAARAGVDGSDMCSISSWEVPDADGHIAVSTLDIGHGMTITPVEDDQTQSDQRRQEFNVYVFGKWRVELLAYDHLFDDCAHVRIFYDDKLRWIERGDSGNHFYLLPSWDDRPPPDDFVGPWWTNMDGTNSKLPVEDLTGENGITLLVKEWTGGAHAAYNYWVLRLRGHGRVEILRRFDLGNGHLSLARRSDDIAFQLIVEDDCFAYWNGCFAGSPMPVISYDWLDGEYRCTNDRHQLPTDQAESYIVNALTTEALADDLSEQKCACFQTLVDLLWNGHAAKAIELIERFDRIKELGSERSSEQRLHERTAKWWKLFIEQATTSTLWPDLVECFPQLISVMRSAGIEYGPPPPKHERAPAPSIEEDGIDTTRLECDGWTVTVQRDFRGFCNYAEVRRGDLIYWLDTSYPAYELVTPFTTREKGIEARLIEEGCEPRTVYIERIPGSGDPRVSIQTPYFNAMHPQEVFVLHLSTTRVEQPMQRSDRHKMFHPVWADRNSDGVSELVVDDPVFYHSWDMQIPFEGCSLTYGWNGSGYVCVNGKADVLEDGDVEDMRRAAFAQPRENGRYLLFVEYLTKMLYRGRVKEAKQFFVDFDHDLGRGENNSPFDFPQDKAEWWQAFVAKLESSSYWKDLAAAIPDLAALREGMPQQPKPKQPDTTR